MPIYVPMACLCDDKTVIFLPLAIFYRKREGQKKREGQTWFSRFFGEITEKPQNHAYFIDRPAHNAKNLCQSTRTKKAPKGFGF